MNDGSEMKYNFSGLRQVQNVSLSWVVQMLPVDKLHISFWACELSRAYAVDLGQQVSTCNRPKKKKIMMARALLPLTMHLALH